MIANPCSGRDNSPERLGSLLASVREAEVHWTEGPGHARRLVREALARGVRRFVAAGGDGTVSEIAAGLAGAPGEPLLGILPFGTGNDLARSLGVPLDLDRAARVLAEGRERSIDLVRIDSARRGLMVNASVAGLGGDITSGLDHEMKRTWGPSVYLRMALDNIASAGTFAALLTLDGREMELEVANVVIANGIFLGGGIPVAPLARTDDGLLDVLILPALSAVGLFGLVPWVLAGRQHLSRKVVHLRAASVRVEAEVPMPVTIDGEPWGCGPVSYEVQPRALRVLCPVHPSVIPVRYRLS